MSLKKIVCKAKDFKFDITGLDIRFKTVTGEEAVIKFDNFVNLKEPTIRIYPNDFFILDDFTNKKDGECGIYLKLPCDSFTKEVHYMNME